MYERIVVTMAKLKEFFQAMRKFSPEEEKGFVFAAKYLPQHKIDELKRLMKLRMASVESRYLDVVKENVPYVSGDVGDLNERIFEEFKRISYERFAWEAFLEIKNVISGAEKKLGDSGRVLVRLSGTEPLVRVMLEGKDKEEIERLGQEIVNVIREKIAK